MPEQLPLQQWGASNVYLLVHVVQLKGKPHCCNGVVDTFGHYATYQCGRQNVFKEKNDHENMKKTPSKVVHNWPKFFLVLAWLPKQPKTKITYHKKPLNAGLGNQTGSSMQVRIPSKNPEKCICKFPKSDTRNRASASKLLDLFVGVSHRETQPLSYFADLNVRLCLR